MHRLFLPTYYFIVILLIAYRYSFFNIKRTLIKSLLFKFVLAIFFFIFTLVGIGDYSFLITYAIYGLILFGFMQTTNKLKVIFKMVFILLFFYLALEYLNLLCFISLDCNNQILMCFLSDYSSNWDFYFKVTYVGYMTSDLSDSIIYTSGESSTSNPSTHNLPDTTHNLPDTTQNLPAPPRDIVDLGLLRVYSGYGGIDNPKPRMVLVD